MSKKAAPKETPAQPIPSIDENASLKIDAIEQKEENEPQEKSNKRLFILGGVVLTLIILGVLGFIFLYIQNPPEKKSAITPVVQGSTQASPSATLPVLVRSEWTFEVLNGSGVAGAAKKAKDKLEALGYTGINTDNADTSDYTENKLYVTAGMADKEALLIADLKADFNIASVSGALKDSTASARLIVGKE